MREAHSDCLVAEQPFSESLISVRPALEESKTCGFIPCWAGSLGAFSRSVSFVAESVEDFYYNPFSWER